jgi:outer membrane protein assembly factor BamB
MKFLKTGIFVVLLSTLIYTQGADMIERALFGGSESRNMSLSESNIPSNWDAESGANILWRAALGSQTYTNPTIVGKNLFIATNNEGLKNPKLTGDRGVLMAFGKADGTFLWQATHEKLPSGLVNDWPLQGICSTPYVEGDKIYYVSNRCEVVCIDAKGFLDGENNGPYTSEVNNTNIDADIIWKYDMMDELDVFPHNLAAGSPLIVGDILFTVTGNGVDESHILLPSPAAPSFIALNKNTGELLWEDNSPGENILHGTWSNPAYGIVNNVPQVVFPGGDGWLYSFVPETGELIWKFNCNPEGSKWILGGSGTKNNIISTPVFYDNKVYLGVGQDPEHGEAPGHFWVIDASGKGDITKTGVVWHRGGEDFYRTMSTAAIANDLLFISDLSGFLYCLDPKTGEHYWTYDTEAAIWGSPMVMDNKVYLGDEDGDVVVFKADKKMEVIHEVNMGSAVYSTPVAKDGVLYIASRTQLYAIKNLTE